MAPISKFIPFLFLTTLLLSLQISARDSQFFSKVSNVNNNNFKETEVPKNEEPLNKPEQQPVFIPETENSYGLYGHESGQNPPTTTTTTTKTTTTPTTTYQPYKTESEEKFRKYNPNNNNYNNDFYRTNQNEMRDTRLAGTPSRNNNYFYSNKDNAFGDKQNQLSDIKYTEGGYNSVENQNNKKKYYYNNNNNKNSFQNNAVNNKYYGERQGISDTRFMEGGKYFYDVDSEKYNPTLYGGSSRGVNSENMVNNNNVNSYENKNSMEGYYQNQEEFDDVQEDFEP